MKVIIENWAVAILVICTIAVVVAWVCKFAKMPTDQQIAKVKEILLLWVVLAEKELGAKTGALKLRYCYQLFTEKFPYLAAAVTFETFSNWVDEVLEQAKHLLATNENIKNYVEGTDGDTSTN